MNPDAPAPPAGRGSGSSGAANTPSPQNSIASSPLPVVTVPDHELIRPIGKGSCGEVWLAKHRVARLLKKEAQKLKKKMV